MVAFLNVNMKLILIIGPWNSGKTRLAFEMTDAKNRGYIDARILKKFEVDDYFDSTMDYVDSLRGSLILDEAPPSKVKELIRFFSREYLEVNRMMQVPAKVKTPQIIIISACKLEDLNLSSEQRHLVSIFETSIDANNDLNIRMHEANKTVGIHPKYFMPDYPPKYDQY